VGPCAVPDGRGTTCTIQRAAGPPVLWPGHTRGVRYPYATLGAPDWSDYVVSVDTLLTRAGTTTGVLGRFGSRGNESAIGRFTGYLFDVSSTGAWRLIRNNRTAAGTVTLAAGRLASPFGVDRWHRLALAMTGDTVTGYVDGHRVASAHDGTWTQGQAGVEAGAFTASWPQAQYANLSVVPSPGVRGAAVRNSAG
jgi:hypothetical protein